MKEVFEKIQGGRLTHVTVIQEDGSSLKYTSKDDIEQACLEENCKKFSQTSNTPAMIGQLADELGYDQTSEACKQIVRDMH